MQQPGTYEPVADMEAEPMVDPDLEPEPEPELEPEPEQSHLHLDAHSYHPDVLGNDYFLGLSGGGYHYEFDIFGSYLSQYNTPGLYPLQYISPPGSYPLHHGTASGSSSSMSFEPHDFFAMFSTPPPRPEEDVGHHEHPQRERRPLQRYTPRTTPSNHHF
ncbi:hypothetical protein J1N35_043487 [Gossypium stocksii]|uniref:Uncharacterized protein n=1 Tax=Gossypium stocksii TaxID=47602 RepID=A0A9D3ZFG6_9ROSI|nr:hypothetical protein J1N35_043487 [Gossypium stocksii]